MKMLVKGSVFKPEVPEVPMKIDQETLEHIRKVLENPMNYGLFPGQDVKELRSKFARPNSVFRPSFPW